MMGLAMFGFKRFWIHLIDWMTQNPQADATIFNAHYAFETACITLPELAKELLSDGDMWEGHGQQSVSILPSAVTFRPWTTKATSSSCLELLQASQGVSHSAGSLQHRETNNWRAELHLCCSLPSCARLACIVLSTLGQVCPILRSAAVSPSSGCQSCQKTGSHGVSSTSRTSTTRCDNGRAWA